MERGIPLRLMVTDEDDRINAFQEKPKEPKSNLASIGASTSSTGTS